MFAKLTSPEAMDFIHKLEEPFKNLPHLPKGLTEFFVKIAPYLALLGAILSLIGGPVIGLLGAFGSLLTLSPMLLIWTVVAAVVSLLSAILLFMAFNPLKARQMNGWVYLFWSEILSILTSVLGIIDRPSSAVGAIIGALIGLYILFEMKPFYSGLTAKKSK